MFHPAEFELDFLDPSVLPNVRSDSSSKFGVIDVLRASRSEQQTLELVHRLDRDTSGCLLRVQGTEEKVDEVVVTGQP